jgi:hypothetical protein
MQPQLQAQSDTPGHGALLGLDLVRSANETLHRFLADFAGEAVQGTGNEVAAMLQLERTLQSVGRLLKGNLQASQDAELRDEIAQYRDNLVRLRQELSALQSSAANCRARLFTREEHLHAARAWCAATRTTR